MKNFDQLREHLIEVQIEVEEPIKEPISEVEEPKSSGEKRFKFKHLIARKEHPVAGDEQFKGKGKDKSRIADREEEDDKKVYETAEGKSLLDEGNLEVLQRIVKKKQAESVKFKTGGTAKVDGVTAGALVAAYNALNDQNKKKFEAGLDKGPTTFMKLVDLAMKNTKFK